MTCVTELQREKAVLFHGNFSEPFDSQEMVQIMLPIINKRDPYSILTHLHSTFPSDGSGYARIDQVKFFKGCLQQILLGQFLNTLTHMWINLAIDFICKSSYMYLYNSFFCSMVRILTVGITQKKQLLMVSASKELFVFSSWKYSWMKYILCVYFWLICSFHYVFGNSSPGQPIPCHLSLSVLQWHIISWQKNSQVVWVLSCLRLFHEMIFNKGSSLNFAFNIKRI